MTPLAAELRRMITLEGPIPVDRYMALCLAHPPHGYYLKRDPLGQAGDFTTAPEISQMFGEMLGVWAASVWAQMGRPAPFALVELGPGRGTLMADLWRAAKAMPGFRDAARVTLVEISPALRAKQSQTLSANGLAAKWAMTIDDIPAGMPALILANEFFDALPVRQLIHSGAGWHERMVGIGADGALTFGLSPDPARDVMVAGRKGDVREFCPDGQRIARALAERIMRDGGAMLAIDYGSTRSLPGDSLQAVKGHAFVDPLVEPGEADLTAHVDFAALAAAARAGGAAIAPLLSQKSLLERLGIAVRAQALADAAPARAAEISAALVRLTGAQDGQMGTLFKALAIFQPSLARLPAFDLPDPVLHHLMP